MKVKAKLSALTLALALAGGALIGCNQGGGNPPAPPVKYYVTCSSDSAKYEVSAFEVDGYAAGETVTFSVTEKDSENWVVTSVTSDDVNVQTVSALNYKFTMPAKDVNLVVNTREVEKWELTTTETDPREGVAISFSLEFGHEARTPFVIEGRDAAETAKITKEAEGKYSFQAGDYSLTVKYNDEAVITGYALSVRELEKGETEDNPLSSTEMVSKGHQLPICSGNNDPDIANKLSKYYWVVGKLVSFQAEPSTEYSNLTCTLEGGLVLYRVGCKQGVDHMTAAVGSILKVYGQVYNYGNSSTQQANGKVQFYTGNNPKSQVKGIDNSVLESIVLSTDLVSLSVGGTEVVTATLLPDDGQKTVSWEIDNEAIATYEVDASDSRKVTVTAASEGETTIVAKVGTVVSSSARIIVSNTKLVYRPLSLSEMLTATSAQLAFEDTDGNFHYSNGEPLSETVYYLPTTTASGEAAKASIVKHETEDKYAVKFADYYIGYEWGQGTDGNNHHNMKTVTEVTDALVAWFTFDANTGKFSITGGDDAHTELYLGKHATQDTIRLVEAKYDNPLVHLYGWAENVAITEVNLEPENLSLFVGASAVLTYTYKPFNAVVESVLFESASPEYVTVNATTGEVTAVKEVEGVAVSVKVNDVLCAAACTVEVKKAGETEVVEIEASELGMTSTASPGAAVNYTEGSVTIALSAAWKGTFNSVVHARCGANSTMTFSVTDKKITKIEFVCTGDASGKDYGPKNLTITEGAGAITVGGDSSQRTGTWDGETSNLVLTCSAQVRLISVKVTVVSAAA